MRQRRPPWWRSLVARGFARLAALPLWFAEGVWLLAQFVVAGVVLFTAGIATETGTALLTRWVDRMVPALHVTYESGTLRTGVVWRDLGWRDEALTVHVDRVTMALDWGALARRTVHLHALELERATVTVKPQPDDAQPRDWRAELDALAATLKAVPVAIAVDRFAATALTIHHPAMTAPYRIDRLSWRGALRATDATLDDLLIASADGALSGALTAEWRTVPRVSAALTARHGSAQLVVAGAGDADGTVEMHLRFVAPQLAQLPLVKQLRLPLAGRVVVEGAMRGPWHTPELALEAAFDRLTWGDAPPIDRVRGQLTGTLARHEIRVQAASAPGSVALTVAGAARTGAADAAFAWQGALTAFTITSPQLGVWRLRKASALTWRPGAWQVAPLCLIPGEAAGELCLSTQQRPEAPVSAHATARFPLATVQRLAQPWLPNPHALAGIALFSDSSPRSTGPAGAQFEAKVGTHYALALLANTEPFGLPGAIVDRIEFQRGGQEHPLDDVIVRGKTAEGADQCLEVQVKRAMAFFDRCCKIHYRRLGELVGTEKPFQCKRLEPRNAKARRKVAVCKNCRALVSGSMCRLC